jgi:uncharacterized repeat protein (TIGR02543 family)
MSSAFLDLTGLSRFLDHLKLLLVQSDWQKTDSTDMAFIKNKPTVSVDEQTLVLTGWGSGSAVETFTVRFMLNDGTETVYDSQTVNSGSTVSVPSDPTRTDYNFGGWYTDSSCTTAFDSTTAITRNTDLYAKWTAQSSEGTCTITIDPNLEHQKIALWSNDSSFHYDWATNSATINSGGVLGINLSTASGDTYQEYTFGSILVDGADQQSTRTQVTVTSNITISATPATKNFINLGNYSGQITVGSYGDTTSAYSSVVGYSTGGVGNLTSTSWGDFTIADLGIMYGKFGLSLNGQYLEYAKSCITGTLTIGTCSVALSEGKMGNSDTETLRAYLVEHIGEILNVSIELTALESATEIRVVCGSYAGGVGYYGGGYGSLTPNPVPVSSGNYIQFQQITAQMQSGSCTLAVIADHAFNLLDTTGSDVLNDTYTREMIAKYMYENYVPNSNFGMTFYVKAGS